MKSHKWHDAYVIPGGHIELGETAEEALRREIKEETALDIYGIEFICCRNSYTTLRSGKSATSSSLTTHAGRMPKTQS